MSSSEAIVALCVCVCAYTLITNYSRGFLCSCGREQLGEVLLMSESEGERKKASIPLFSCLNAFTFKMAHTSQTEQARSLQRE